MDQILLFNRKLCTFHVFSLLESFSRYFTTFSMSHQKTINRTKKGVGVDWHVELYTESLVADSGGYPPESATTEGRTISRSDMTNAKTREMDQILLFIRKLCTFDVFSLLESFWRYFTTFSVSHQ